MGKRNIGESRSTGQRTGCMDVDGRSLRNRKKLLFSSWNRLKRSAETAAHYTLPQLEACLQVLLELDQSLKSQPVAAQTLLETALCRLALAGSGR